MARNNPCKYIFEIKPGEFKEFTEAELKDYLLEQDLSKFKSVKDALQERSAKEEVPFAAKPGKNIPESSERIRSSQQRVEASEEAQDYEEALRGITKAENQARREELGLPVYKGEVVTDAEIRQRAADELAKGYDYNSLIKRMEQGNPTSAVESEMLKMYASELDARLQKDPYNKDVQKALARFTEAKLTSGATMGRDFRALKGTAASPLEQLETLSDYVTVARDANGVNELTDTQMKKVVQEYEKIQKEVAKLKEQKEELERLNTESLAQQEFNRARKEAQKTKSVKRDYKKEREDVISSIRAKLKQSRESGNLYSSPIPYKPVVDLVKISPEIAKLVKIYAEEGIQKLDQVVKNIHDLLKDEVEGLTERNVIDAIAGKFNKPAKPLSEEKANLLNLNREAKLASKLLDLKYGKESEFAAKNKVEKTESVKQREDQLRKEKLVQLIQGAKSGEKAQEKKQIAKNREIAELEKQLKEARKEGGYYDESRLRALIKRNETKAKEIQQRIENKQFEEKAKLETFIQNPEIKKKYPELYKDWLDKSNKVDDLKHDFIEAAEKDRLERLGLWGKTKETGSMFVNTVKSLKAGIDNSAVFVQNNTAMLNPSSWGLSVKKQPGKFLPKVSFGQSSAAKALKFQWQAFASEAALRRRITEMYENKPVWDMIQKSGLDILDPKGFKSSIREESMGGRNLLEKKYFGVQPSKYSTAPFERLFTGFSNEIRYSLFSEGAKNLLEQGKTIENSLQDYKDLASKINNITGRGKIMSKGAEPYLNFLMWSPKLFASNLNKLGLSDIVSNKLWGKRDKEGRPMGYYSNMNPEGRAKAISATVGNLSTIILTMSALSLRKNTEVDWDPESVTFGQVKDTETGWNVNLFGPYSSIIRYLVMIGSSATSPLTGRAPVKKIGGRAQKVDAIEETYKFFRGKANPVTGIGADIIFNKTFSGKPYDYSNLPSDLFEPLFVKDFRSQFKASGASAFLFAIPTFYGLKVQNDKQYDQRDLKSLIDNNVYSTNFDPSTIFNYNDGGRPINKSEFENFKKTRDSILNELITNMSKNGFPVSENGKKVQKMLEDPDKKKVATKDQLYEILKELKSEATRVTKLKLFGIKELDEDDSVFEVKDAKYDQGLKIEYIEDETEDEKVIDNKEDEEEEEPKVKVEEPEEEEDPGENQ
jgi:hypothetical protein